jgi:hydrogenase nickel incorporation protein HypA/HybF
MHELSVAMSLISLAENETIKAGNTRIISVKVMVGYLSGIDFESFSFMLDLAKKNTLLEKAAVEFVRMAGKGKCRSCGHDFPVDEQFAVCPECRGNSIEITGGDELRIISMVVD